jgi:[ribosomal protein S18]-alanine N-acetyltransferase
MTAGGASVSELTAADRDGVLEIARLVGADLDLEAELRRSFALILVARDEPTARPLGFLLAWLVADEVHLIDLGTHPDHRRSGVGKALLATLLARARSQRARLVLLEVRRSNQAALELYRSHGFRAIRIRRGYYDGGTEDAIEMSLELPEQDEPPPNSMKDV